MLPLPPDDTLKVVLDTAKMRDLDPALVCAICLQESGWKPWAIRYEPSYMWLYPPGARDASDLSPSRGMVSQKTEEMQQKTSWG